MQLSNSNAIKFIFSDKDGEERTLVHSFTTYNLEVDYEKFTCTFTTSEGLEFKIQGLQNDRNLMADVTHKIKLKGKVLKFDKSSFWVKFGNGIAKARAKTKQNSFTTQVDLLTEF